MMLIQTHPDRWVVRDTELAPARATVRLVSKEPPIYRAAAFHVVASSAEQIGDFPSLDAAFEGVRSYVSSTFRTD